MKIALLFFPLLSLMHCYSLAEQVERVVSSSEPQSISVSLNGHNLPKGLVDSEYAWTIIGNIEIVVLTSDLEEKNVKNSYRLKGTKLTYEQKSFRLDGIQSWEMEANGGWVHVYDKQRLTADITTFVLIDAKTLRLKIKMSGSVPLKPGH
jgi:hypothetical protein